MARGRRVVIGVLACACALAGTAACAGPASARDAVVTSFDGTPIAVHLYGPTTPRAGGTAPTVLVGSTYPSPGETRAGEDVGGRIGLATLRGAGYNVLTWDPRGIGASAGSIMFDSPAFEGGDVRAIIDFVATQPEAQLDAPGDPRLGMSGTSYGATIQYITAALDTRVDAIVPDIGWESLTRALRRGGAVKTGWLAGLCGLDAVPGAIDGKASAADVKPATASDELKAACLEGVRGRLSKRSRKWLADHGPGSLIGSIRAPALIMQGTTDTLFPLDQASEAFAALRRSGVPVKMLWYCGGHVPCASETGDPRMLARAGLAWLNRWLRQDPAVDTGPPFEWFADDGVWRSGPDFPLASIGALDAVGSGSLKIAPRDSPLRGLGRSSVPAGNSIDVPLPAPSGETDLVGNPRVRLVYRGRAKPERTFLYAQVVDGEADRVIGGLATPLPVILDGRQRTVERPMEAIAEHGRPASLYRLQITPGAATYELQRSRGRVSIYGAFSSLPLVDAARSGYGVVRRTPRRPRVAVTSRREGARHARVSLRVRLPVRPCSGSITFVVQTSRRPYVYKLDADAAPVPGGAEGAAAVAAREPVAGDRDVQRKSRAQAARLAYAHARRTMTATADRHLLRAATAFIGGSSLLFGTVPAADARDVNARDVQALIDFVATAPEALLDSPNDPRVGMSGTSYGGAIQLATAAIDGRLDALVADSTWHSLGTGFFPEGAMKTAFAALVCGYGTAPGVPGIQFGLRAATLDRAAPQLETLHGELGGAVSPPSRQWFADRTPPGLRERVSTPTLLTQGTVDTVFGLSEAVANIAPCAAGAFP